MAESWLTRLNDEDESFIKRFILASGSLKELAEAYGISYPTVRLRLDRLIEKIKILDSAEIVSEFERTLRARYAEGKLDIAYRGATIGYVVGGILVVSGMTFVLLDRDKGEKKKSVSWSMAPGGISMQFF